MVKVVVVVTMVFCAIFYAAHLDVQRRIAGEKYCAPYKFEYRASDGTIFCNTHIMGYKGR